MDRGARWNVASGVVTTVVAAAVGLAPLQTVESTAVDSGGQQMHTTEHLSLLATEGAGLLAALLVPNAVVAAPLLWQRSPSVRRVRLWVVALLAVLVVLGAMSIGVFFLPTLVTMAVAVHFTPRPVARR